MLVEVGHKDADSSSFILPHPKKLESVLLVKCCRLFVIFAGPRANFIISQASKSVECRLDEVCTDALALGAETNPEINDFCLREIPFGIISGLERFGPPNRSQ